MCTTASALVRSILYTLLWMDKKREREKHQQHITSIREKGKNRKSNTLVTNTRCQRGISKQKWQTHEKNVKRKINTFFFHSCVCKKKTKMCSSESSFPSTCSALHADHIRWQHKYFSHSLQFSLSVSLVSFEACALIAACNIRLNFYETKWNSSNSGARARTHQIRFICAVCPKCTLGFGIYFNIVNLGIIWNRETNESSHHKMANMHKRR